MDRSRKPVLTQFVRQLTLVLYVFLCSTGQAAGQQRPVEYVPVSNLVVSGVALGDGVQILRSKIGDPDSIVVMENEFEATEYFAYCYGASRFTVENHKVEGFHLKDPVFRLNSLGVAVGDSILVLVERFPLAVQHQTIRNGNAIIRVRIGTSDSYLLFICRKQRITEIRIWNDL